MKMEVPSISSYLVSQGDGVIVLSKLYCNTVSQLCYPRGESRAPGLTLLVAVTSGSWLTVGQRANISRRPKKVLHHVAGHIQGSAFVISLDRRPDKYRM